MATQGIAAKRALAAQLQRAAGKKVSRLERVVGVSVRDTKNDPRVESGKINRYNSAQLDAHINRLQQFNSRQTRFVPDANRNPIPYSVWQDYKRTERAVNKIANEQFAAVSGTLMPNSDPKAKPITVAQRRAIMTPDHMRSGSVAVNSPFSTIERDSRRMDSLKSVKKLTAAMKQKLQPTHFKKQEQAARQQFSQIMEVLNRPKLSEKVGKLNSKQFQILWNLTNFANALSLEYELAQAKLAGKKERWYDPVAKNESEEVEAYVNWASNIGAEDKRPQKPRNQKPARRRK